jgi:hypothetical protein
MIRRAIVVGLGSWALLALLLGLATLCFKPLTVAVAMGFFQVRINQAVQPSQQTVQRFQTGGWQSLRPKALNLKVFSYKSSVEPMSTSSAVLDGQGTIYRGTNWQRQMLVGVHLGLVAVLLALFPVISLIRGPLRRSRRRRRGRCLVCGYDLRGNVSGVCPECGEAVPRERTEQGEG